MASLKHVSEYLALRGIGTVAAALPYSLAMAWGRAQADLFFPLLGRRRREAFARIEEVFGTRFNRREIESIARQSWRNIVMNGMEMMRVGRADLEWARRVCPCDQYLRVLREHLQTGQGAILACPHTGSWEMGSVVSRLHGLPVFSIGAQQRNPLVNAYIQALREKPGIEIIPRGAGTMKRVFRKLKAGELLGILPDVRSREPGFSVPFLNGTANLHKGMGLFATQTGCPVFPVIAQRHGLVRHSLTLYPPVYPDPALDKQEDGLRITREVARVIDRAIQNEPGQWFWYNKRWILEPLHSQEPRELP